MTRRKAKKLSIELWTWLSKNPFKIKLSWPKAWDTNLEFMFNHCFLCEVLAADCDKCPLCKNNITCLDIRHPYQQWRDSYIEKDRRKYARQIVSMLKKNKFRNK